MVSSRLRTALALSVTLAFFLGLPFDTSARGGGRSIAHLPRSSASGSRTLTTAATCVRCYVRAIRAPVAGGPEGCCRAEPLTPNGHR
jgi:hypothetical protein